MEYNLMTASCSLKRHHIHVAIVLDIILTELEAFSLLWVKYNKKLAWAPLKKLDIHLQDESNAKFHRNP